MSVHPNMLKAAQRLLNSTHRFASDELLTTLPQLSRSDLDELPFGVIKLDDNGVVEEYNTYESELAQREKENTYGRLFFSEIAPCTNTPIFSGIFFHGVKNKNLSAFLSYIFAFKSNPTHVWIHMHRCIEDGSNWILVQKRASSTL